MVVRSRETSGTELEVIKLDLSDKCESIYASLIMTCYVVEAAIKPQLCSSNYLASTCRFRGFFTQGDKIILVAHCIKAGMTDF